MSDTQTSAPARLAWVDAAKGLAILLVILGHALNGVKDAGLADAAGVVNGASYYIYTFHMAAFFFLSGLFLAPRTARQGYGVLAKIPVNLIWPYLLWGWLLLAVQLVTENYLNRPLGPSGVDLFLDVWRSPPGPFWYIYVLIFYQIVAVVFLRLRAMLWLAPLAVVLFLLAEVVREVDPVLYVGLHFFLFFVIGVLAGSKSEALDSRWKYDSALLALALLVAIVPIAVCAQGVGVRYYDFRLLPVALAGAAALMILARSRWGSSQAWLVYIGERTLPIYVMHVFFTAGARIALTKIGGVSSPAVLVPAAFVAGLVLPLIAYEIAVFLRATKILGLGPALSRRRSAP